MLFFIGGYPRGARISSSSGQSSKRALGSPGKVPVAMIPHDFSIECKISCNKEESQQTHHGFCDKRMKAKCQLRVWKLAWGKLPLGKC